MALKVYQLDGKTLCNSVELPVIEPPIASSSFMIVMMASV